MARHKESNLQIQCVEWFRLQYPSLKKLLFAVPNGSFLQGGKVKRAIQGKRLKKEGVVEGVSDLILAVPNKDYPVLFIEMKTEKGRQTENQKDFEENVLNQGYDYRVVRSLKSFIEIVNQHIKNK